MQCIWGHMGANIECPLLFFFTMKSKGKLTGVHSGTLPFKSGACMLFYHILLIISVVTIGKYLTVIEWVPGWTCESRMQLLIHTQINHWISVIMLKVLIAWFIPMVKNREILHKCTNEYNTNRLITKAPDPLAMILSTTVDSSIAKLASKIHPRTQ